eukprot:821185-Rhodomonas_salina.1
MEKSVAAKGLVPLETDVHLRNVMKQALRRERKIENVAGLSEKPKDELQAKLEKYKKTKKELKDK